MKRKFFGLVVILILTVFIGNAQDNKETKIIVNEKDKLILQEKFDKFSKDKNTPIGELIIKIGNDFIGTPYVGKTLDINIDESLIINLRELDCTTFMETTLAIARVIKSGKMDFGQYASELEKIRYQNGICDGYESRLHYFTTWLTDNQSKGIVENATLRCGGEKYPVNLWFMSKNPQSYPQLQKKPGLIKKVNAVEREISGKDFYYIPKNKVGEIENKINDGDIVAFTTTIKGMDVSHVGLLFKKEGHVYLLHASSTDKKVETTEALLTTFLINNKNITGIMVVRPNF